MTFCGRLFPRTTTQERPPPSRSRYRPIFAGGRETVCAHQRDADGCKATSRSRKRKENDGLSGHDGLLHGWFLDDIYCSTDDFGRAHRRWITPLGRQAPVITWDLGGGASERGNAIRSNSQSAPPRKALFGDFRGILSRAEIEFAEEEKDSGSEVVEGTEAARIGLDGLDA